MMTTALDLWRDIDAQDWDSIEQYFLPAAEIRWHNTRELFTPAEFVQANREYPGDWAIEVERVAPLDVNTVMTVVQVRMQPDGPSFHATSFFAFAKDGKILKLDEYWGDDGDPPAWRAEKAIGKRF